MGVAAMRNSADTTVSAVAPAPGVPLSRVIYRSRATRALSRGDLTVLIAAAQQRNAQESVTGLVVYDNERFFQWLEGPPANVARVMTSINHDPRHTEIDVLHSSNSTSRAFGYHHMHLVAPEAQAGYAAPHIVADLHSRPTLAPSLLVQLVSLSARVVAPASVAASADPAAILQNVFLNAVVPQLARARSGRLQGGALLGAALPGAALPGGALPGAARPGAASANAPLRRPVPAVQHRIGALAAALVEAGPDRLPLWLETLQHDGSTVAELARTLFEPAARRLGDLWADDSCSEFDVTFALCRLQGLARLLAAPCAARRAGRGDAPRILIAPEPGELHRLGAALDGIVMENWGWSPVTALPDDNAGLAELLADRWFDVLDLSLSAAFRREHDLPRLAETIHRARLASRNPGLKIIVGGRFFAEERDACARVGADAVHGTASQVGRAVLGALSHRRSALHAA